MNFALIRPQKRVVGKKIKGSGLIRHFLGIVVVSTKELSQGQDKISRLVQI